MKDKLIYIYPKKATFIQNDLDFLEKKFQVITQDLDWGNAIKLPLNLIRQFIFLVVNIRKSKAIIINFGGYFSLLPSLLGKLFGIKTFIILNGTDCVSFPIYNYGSLRKPLLKFFIKCSHINATKLFPVDDSLIYQHYSYDDKVNQKEQGLKAFFPSLRTAIKVIPNGFNVSLWNSNKEEARKGFITVGFVNSFKSYQVKGIDLILEVAAKFPKENFTIVGMSEEFKKTLQEFPENVTTIPYLDKEDLKIAYQKHLGYLQISINEGFGCALAEAMLCGCIPIVSNAGALPNVTKNAGFIVNKKEVALLEKAIQKVIHLNTEQQKNLALEAHKIISENFDISIRERLILQEIES
jgi:glycosyltransferase involved in cell wall biosynthesis